MLCDVCVYHSYTLRARVRDLHVLRDVVDRFRPRVVQLAPVISGYSAFRGDQIIPRGGVLYRGCTCSAIRGFGV